MMSSKESIATACETLHCNVWRLSLKRLITQEYIHTLRKMILVLQNNLVFAVITLQIMH